MTTLAKVIKYLRANQTRQKSPPPSSLIPHPSSLIRHTLRYALERGALAIRAQ